MSRTRVLTIGHRGAAGYAPENTLAAVAAGLAHGADLLEIDVQRSADGTLVVMHDKRVDRTTNGSGRVEEMSLAEIRRLDAGQGERVPTLAEVLQLANGRAGLMIELVAEGIGREVLAEVERAGFTSPVIYASFVHAEILDLRQAKPEARTLALLEGVPVSGARFAIDAGATYVGLAHESLTRSLVDACHQAGLNVFVYTVNDARDLEWVRAWAADGIITDYPNGGLLQ